MTAREASKALSVNAQIGVSAAAAIKGMAEAHRAFERFAIDARRAMRRMARLMPRLKLVVEHPADVAPTRLRDVPRWLRDIVVHEFWMEAGQPERSPGARWVILKAVGTPLAPTAAQLLRSTPAQLRLLKGRPR